MEDQLSAKQRRRPITACSECQRRKQKCNRQKPCSHCTSRRVPARCAYDETTVSQRISKIRSRQTTVSSGEQTCEEITPETTPEESQYIPDEIGYSSFYGSDVYGELKHLLEDDDVFRAATALTSRTQRYDPSRKFWALISQMPPKNVQEDLITIFFRDVHWRFSTVERVYFDELYTQWSAVCTSTTHYADLKTMSRKLQYFPALLLQLCALTLQFVRVGENCLAPSTITDMIKDESACEDLSYKYSDVGMELLALLGRHQTDLVAIQAYIIRAAFLKNFGHGIESWYVIGDAIRQAQELELHRQAEVLQLGDDSGDIETSLHNFWADEFRRRLWLILFTWDSSMALILGRPRMINTSDCNIKPPLDCAFPENPSKTIPMLSGTTASSFSIVLFRYAVAYKIHEIRSMGADKRCPMDYEVVWSLHNQITSLLDTLPLYLRPSNPDVSWDLAYPYLRVQRSEVLTSISAVLMALHLPHITAHLRSRQAALEAGLSCLESQQRIAENSGPQHARYFGCAFYTINACIMVSAVALMYPPEDTETRRLIEEGLSQSISRLTSIENVNLIAKSGINIARKCHAKIRSMFNNLPVIYDYTTPDPPSLTTGSVADTDQQAQLFTFDPSTMVDELQGANVMTDGDPFTYFKPTDFDTSYWISKVNQIPDASGTDPTWDHLFENHV